MQLLCVYIYLYVNKLIYNINCILKYNYFFKFY